MAFDALPEGWEVWSEAATKVVLVFRPDVFDTDAFPAPCLPTIYLTKGERNRRPGPNEPDPDDRWYVTLYLEPDVNLPPKTAPTRRGAAERATTLASRFLAGDIDFWALYQVPRENYLERLTEMVGE